MVNTEILEEFISKSGKTKSHLAEKSNMAIQTFRKKSTNRAVFNLSEVEVLCDELGIKTMTDKNRIFFAKKVDNMSTDVE